MFFANQLILIEASLSHCRSLANLFPISPRTYLFYAINSHRKQELIDNKNYKKNRLHKVKAVFFKMLSYVNILLGAGVCSVAQCSCFVHGPGVRIAGNSAGCCRIETGGAIQSYAISILR